MGAGTLGAAGAPDHKILRTESGRTVSVGTLALGGRQRPARRITVDIGACEGCHESAWAALTVEEARRLAGSLLSQAAAADRDGQPRVQTAGCVEVAHAGGESYAITTRGHALLADQPVDAGGGDAAPTPTELFVGSLASCVAFYTGRYLLRHGLKREGLHVGAEFALAADRPARVGAVRMRITVPGGVPARRRDGLLAVAAHCTVHNTLRREPEVTVELAAQEPAGLPAAAQAPAAEVQRERAGVA
jgi:putative redox protein